MSAAIFLTKSVVIRDIRLLVLAGNYFLDWGRQSPIAQMQAVSRKPISRVLTFSLIVSLLLLAAVLFITRWSPDRAWAAKVVIESGEVRNLLDKFRKSQGEFPSSLEELNAPYRQPTDYETRNGSTPEKGRWFYERIGKDDYQLYACARTWVSYYDAMVYRYSESFCDPWTSSLKKSHYLPLGKWRYFRGFSVFTERFYFDEDGDWQDPFRGRPY